MTGQVTDSYSQLKRDEGEVLHAYPDHLGYLTIGVGILIDQRKGGGLRPEESEYIFRNRLMILRRELTSRLPWFRRLDDARQGALINMAFQLGINGLLNFRRTMSLIQSGQYAQAAAEMLDSRWAKQTPERAKRISEQIRTGVWQ